MSFVVIGKIHDVETIAKGSRIRELPRLRRRYGRGRWRKQKGIATVKLADGTILSAELHWYEASASEISRSNNTSSNCHETADFCRLHTQRRL